MVQPQQDFKTLTGTRCFWLFAARQSWVSVCSTVVTTRHITGLLTCCNSRYCFTHGAGVMADADDSPFDCCKWDDTPLPPLTDDSGVMADETVANMVDSPFASSLITPDLLEQLSQSLLTAGKAQASDNSTTQAADSHNSTAPDCITSIRAPAAAACRSDASSTATKEKKGTIQGVASILESPFVSMCLSDEPKQRSLDSEQEQAKSAGAVQLHTANPAVHPASGS